MKNYDPIKNAALTLAGVVADARKAQHAQAVAAAEKMANVADAKRFARTFLLKEATPAQQAVVIKLQKLGAQAVEVKDSAIKMVNKSNACWVKFDGSRVKI